MHSKAHEDPDDINGEEDASSAFEEPEAAASSDSEDEASGADAKALRRPSTAIPTPRQATTARPTRRTGRPRTQSRLPSRTRRFATSSSTASPTLSRTCACKPGPSSRSVPRRRVKTPPRRLSPTATQASAPSSPSSKRVAARQSRSGFATVPSRSRSRNMVSTSRLPSLSSTRSP